MQRHHHIKLKFRTNTKRNSERVLDLTRTISIKKVKKLTERLTYITILIPNQHEPKKNILSDKGQ